MSTPLLPAEWGGRVEVYEQPPVLARPPSGSGKLPRFTLDQAGLVVDSIEDTQARFRKLQADEPHFIGMTIFGSTIKGYATPESDVDVCVYVDMAAAGFEPEKKSLQEPTMTSFDSDWFYYGGTANVVGGAHYRPLARDLDPCRTTKRLLPRSVYAIPIHATALETAAQKYRADAAALAYYHQMRGSEPTNPHEAMADWSSVDHDPMTLASVPNIRQLLKEYEIGTDVIDMLTVNQLLGRIAADEGSEIARVRSEVFWRARFSSEVVPRLFGVAASAGLDHYRTVFIDRIGQDVDPDRAWSHFIDNLAKFENSTKHPRDTTKIAYPRTFEEAVKHYPAS